MNKPQSAEELNALLTAQRKAVMSGHKIVMGNGHPRLRALVEQTFNQTLSSDPMCKFLGLEGLESIWTYHDYRERIQKYQVENQISAIEWQVVTLGDRLVSFPQINDQLACLDSDLQVLRNYRTAVVEAWAEYSQNKGLMFWYEDSYRNHSGVYCDVSCENVLRLANCCEWAMLHDWQDEQEVVLQVGWGNPLEAGYYDHPESDSFYFHSALPETHLKELEQSNAPGWVYEYCWTCPIRR